MAPIISSSQNAKIKQVVQLNKRNVRDRLSLTVVEGGREIGLALDSGLTPVQTFLCPPLLDASTASVAARCRTLAEKGQIELHEVTPEVFAKIAYREGVGGLVTVIPAIGRSLDAISATEECLGLVVDSAEKPGNLGALLRTADAAGVCFVMVCGDGTDLNNPNVIRASLGAVFAIPVVQTSAVEARAWLRQNRYRAVAASPDAPQLYTAADLTGRTAFVLGSEAHGLGDDWLKAADVRVRIPMVGRVDSLNLAASTAILLYEAVRQRSERRSS